MISYPLDGRVDWLKAEQWKNTLPLCALQYGKWQMANGKWGKWANALKTTDKNSLVLKMHFLNLNRCRRHSVVVFNLPVLILLFDSLSLSHTDKHTHIIAHLHIVSYIWNTTTFPIKKRKSFMFECCISPGRSLFLAAFLSHAPLFVIF